MEAANFNNMIPYLMNCSHSGEGWCLDCVKEMVEELEYLKYFRLRCDFGPSHQDIVDHLDAGYMRDRGLKQLPKGWNCND